MITTTVTFLVSYSLDDAFRFVADFRNLVYWGDRISNISPIPSRNGSHFPVYELLLFFRTFQAQSKLFRKGMDSKFPNDYGNL